MKKSPEDEFFRDLIKAQPLEKRHAAEEFITLMRTIKRIAAMNSARKAAA